MSDGAIWLWYIRLWRIAQELELPKPWYLELKHSYFKDRVFINTLFAVGFIVSGGDYHQTPAGPIPLAGVRLSLRMRRKEGRRTVVLAEDRQKVIVATWVSSDD